MEDANPNSKRYSWYKCRPSLIASRIDFALVSQGISDMCENTGYTTGIKSDHLAFYTYFLIRSEPRGRGYWKLNTKHLECKDFMELLNATIEQVVSSCSGVKSNTQTWEFLKFRIREEAREYSRNKAAEIDLIISQLSEKIDEMENDLSNTNLNILENSKQDLNQFLDDKSKACIFRSKARFAEEGEKPTKYYLNLEKSKFNARTCNALHDEKNKNKLITNTQGILRLQENFYKDLYKKDNTVFFECENDTDIVITDDLKHQLNEEITVTEIKKAIKDLPNGKTCGNDGLPIEFYKAFWTRIENIYVGMLKETYDKKKLHHTARIGVINLIPKQYKNTKYLKHLRPITLLQSDYKIIEKVIANRLEPAMHQVINCDQRGFMKGRRICTNIRMIFELMQHAEKENIEAIILQLDFQKCFDKIDFSAIFGSLQYFGIPDYLVNWARILYTDFQACTQNNGHFSRRFNVERGVHQGGPCSSFFFLLCAEIMAIQLRKNKRIQGIPINDILNSLGQYADDADIFSLYKQDSYNSIFDNLERFRAISGFTLNYDKTAVFRIGSLKNSDAMLLSQTTVSWTNEPINVLGVWIANDTQTTLKLNYEAIENKVNAILQDWTHRNSTIIGKIQIVNSLVTSLFVYRMMVLPRMPELLLNSIKQKVIKFIWKGAKPKISYDTLIQEKKNGGLGLSDLKVKDKSLKIGWIQILENDAKLSNIVYNNIAPDLKEKIWSCSMNVADVKYFFNDINFWKQVLEAWFEFKNISDGLTTPQQQILWLNSSIRINNRPFLWITPLRKGLLTVVQLVDNGRFISAKLAFERFGLDLMEYNAILSAIPATIRQAVKANQKVGTLTFYDTMKNKKHLTTLAYKTLLEQSNILDKKLKEWELELHCPVPNNYFQSRFANMYILTNITKYRSFQYRLLHRAIIVNSHLFRWGVRCNNLCTFCNQHKETYTHLFVLCDSVKHIWISLEQLMYEFNDKDINFNVNNVLFDTLVENDAKNVKNFLCIICKQYIYRQRCWSTPPIFEELKTIINSVKTTELYIARKNNHTSKWYKKWGAQRMAYPLDSVHIN